MNFNPMKLRGRDALIILIVLHLLTRIPILLSVNLFNDEECRTATMANEIAGGPSFSLFDFPYLFHHPGRIVEGFLAAPFYMIFGADGLSLKLMYLALSAVLLAMVFLFVRRFFGERTAILTGFLMVFSPPVFPLITLSQGGPFLLNAVMEVAIMFAFFRIFFDGKKRGKDFALFGLVSGFALFVNLVSMLMISLTMLFWLMLDRKFLLKKDFIVYVAFLLVGACPLVHYVLDYGTGTLNHMGVPYYKLFFMKGSISGNISHFLGRFWSFVSSDLPYSFMFSTVSSSEYIKLDYFYYAVVCYSILSLMVLLFRDKAGAAKVAFILSYPVVFTIALAASNVDIRYRFGPDAYRFFPIFYVFIFLIVSIFLHRLWDGRKELQDMDKILHLLFSFVFIGAGVFGTVGLISFDILGEDVGYRPFCYDHLNWGGEADDDCMKLDEEHRDQCLMGKDYGVWIWISRVNPAKDYCEEKARHKPSCFLGLGRLVAVEGKFPEDCDNVGQEYRQYCYEGVGPLRSQMIIYDRGYDNLSQYTFDKIIISMCGYTAQCYRGFGYGVGQYWGAIPEEAVKTCGYVEKRYIGDCFEGMMRAIGEKFGDSPTKAEWICEKIESRYRPYCYRGLGYDVGIIWGFNRTKAEDRCNLVDEDYRRDCLGGMDTFLSGWTDRSG